MPLFVERKTETAQIPTRATEGAAGLDLYADEDITIHEYNRAWVSTGICIELDPYCVGLVWPRSGLAGKGIDTSAGVIDSDYRGEVKVLLCNGTPHKKAINRGDRIAQLIITQYAKPVITEVDSVSDSERGSNGFGSSGT